MRIREGDPLEIFTDNDGEVVFKKYSPVGENDALCPAICGRHVPRLRPAGAHLRPRPRGGRPPGVPKKEFLERRVSGQLEELMEQRRHHLAKAGAPAPGTAGGGYRTLRRCGIPILAAATSPARCASSCRRAAPYPAKATSS